MSFFNDFRYIKSQIEARPELLATSKLRNASHTPVITRTRASYLSELPPTESYHSQRIGRTPNSGFFAPKHQPYRTFGTLPETDVFEWIAFHFDIQPPPRHHPIYQSKNLTEQEKRVLATHTRSNGAIQVSTLSGTKRSTRSSLQGGMSSIHLSLGSSERRQNEVSAGSCYNDTVEREKLRKQYAEEARLPKKFCKYGSTIEVYNPSIYLSSMVRKTSSKCCLVSHQPDSTSTAKNEADTKELQDNLEPVNADEMRTHVKTAFPNLIVALAASHFKSRRSSSRKSSTNALQPQYLMKLQTIYSILCCIHNIKSKELKRMEPLSLVLLNYLSQRPYNSLVKDVTQDFGHSQSTRSRSSGTTMAESKQPMKSLESHGTEHAKCWSDVIEKELPRSIPPWQIQIVYVEDKRKEDLHKKMQTCYEAFQQSKDELSRKTKAKLEEREKTSSEYLLTKLQELKYGANIDKELTDMREKANCIYVGRKREKDSLPKWFVVLEQEVRSTLNDKLLKDGHNLLKKLKQFTVVDTSTAVSHVLEKLCLVVMSIPAHHLCTEPVIGAIKFVLENILQSSPKLCKHWLELRRLPWQHD